MKQISDPIMKIFGKIPCIFPCSFPRKILLIIPVEFSPLMRTTPTPAVPIGVAIAAIVSVCA